MTLAATEVIPLTISAIVGAGAFVTMEKQGFSIFRRDSCMESLCVLAIFFSIWVVGVSLVVAVFGE